MTASDNDLRKFGRNWDWGPASRFRGETSKSYHLGRRTPNAIPKSELVHSPADSSVTRRNLSLSRTRKFLDVTRSNARGVKSPLMRWPPVPRWILILPIWRTAIWWCIYSTALGDTSD